VGADHRQHHRRGQSHRLRIGDRGRAARHLGDPDRDLRVEQLPGGRRMTDAAVEPRPRRAPRPPKRTRPGRVGLHIFLIVTTLVWVFPILWAFFTAMRPYADTSQYGYVSWPKHFNFDNFKNAYTQSDMLHYFFNSLIVAIPAIVIILAFSSALAFVVS